MRTKVSGKKRLTIIIVSLIVLLISLIFIIWKMSTLTRDLLNNDNIRANVECISVAVFDDGEARDIFKTFAPGIELSEELLQIVNKNKTDLCIVNLKYNFLNGTGKEITDFTMDISPIENAVDKLYAYSPLALELKDENSFIFTQSIVMKKSHLDQKYFNEVLPLGFEANFKYTFSYIMEGQAGIKSIKFTTVKREEEIDEYELLFENESKSDAASDGQTNYE